MSVRAKFQCNSINKSPDNSSAVVNLMAVTTGSTENEAWSKYTPAVNCRWLSLTLQHSNSLSREKNTSSTLIQRRSHYKAHLLVGLIMAQVSTLFVTEMYYVTSEG